MQQVINLLLFFALGVLLGIFYDLLTPLRRSGGMLLAGFMDAAFSLCAAAFVFLLAMRFAPDGRVGIWELSAAFSGFIVYINAFDRFVYKFFQILFTLSYKLVKTTYKFKKIFIF